MSIKTFTGKLVSSKLKKFVFPYDSTDENQGPDWKVGDPIEGHWEYVEDLEQADRIENVSEVSYNRDKGSVNKLHSLEGPAFQTGKSKEYYLNGTKYSKDAWTSLREIGKLDGYIDKSLY